MDFYRVLTKETKEGLVEVYPDFIVDRTGDLMIRGGTFYAIWDEENSVWSTDVYTLRTLVDQELEEEARRFSGKVGRPHRVRSMRAFDSGSWKKFLDYVKHMPDNATQLDENLTFANSKVRKEEYASKRLPYALGEGDISAWEELVSTLYAPEERAKIEWAIGSIVAGDSRWIQKFLVFYGPTGTGKSTILNIINKLFDGYSTTFDGKALGSANNGSFATGAFKDSPLVAIQHDGDMSRIDDNTRLNSLISHEEIRINEKYRPEYSSRINAMLFMGSNQPVRISDSKSGIIRRLIDVHPTGVKLQNSRYNTLMKAVMFQLGAVAHHCLRTYEAMGATHYDGYRPLTMMFQTDVFFNFIEAYYDVFKYQDAITIQQAYKLYKEFCEETGVPHPLPQYKMREELRNYFDVFEERGQIDGKQVRSVYRNFNAERFKEPANGGDTFKLVIDETESLFDVDMAEMSAQLAKPDGTPAKKWSSVKTKLSDVDTREVHYVKVPSNHVVIDFDLQDATGVKALDRNLKAASSWPPTYAELSKSGNGVHLHYQYHGDVDQLAPIYADGIEVKVYKGDSSLRRGLSLCNSLPVAVISAGLPLKEKKEKMLKDRTIKTEVGLRKLIERNLQKEIHPGTKPSIDFIKKILDDAYEDGVVFDVTNLRSRMVAFANNSTNQAELCLKTLKEIRWKSSDGEEIPSDPELDRTEDRPVFFDVEVYPNLFVVCWKFQGAPNVIKMVNPKPVDIEGMFALKLIGFYNRRYDNHILYAASMGATPEQLFKLSSRMIEGNRNAGYGAAYGISYADIWDFSSEKKSLKKWEIDLGLLHLELDFPWDAPVPEKDWPRVVKYCENDVRATEALFEHLKGDFQARQILAELSGMAVNDSTQNHTAKIIFGDDRNPQREFVYTDLSTQFPGYVFELGKSRYKGEDPGEGGYVYAEPGIYERVAVLDVASMHPTSIEVLNLFGRYTERFSDLKRARMAIKHLDYEAARSMLDGKLAKFVDIAEVDANVSKALAYALKIVINTVYGLTSAKFDNPFRDIRNKDNIVAKRGALFMIDLKEQIQRADFSAIHIKTDSVKIPNATAEATSLVITIGSMYGYEFEHEVTYDKFCLVNDAVYIARKDSEWTAVGAQFAHPYVFKTLFSQEETTFNDFLEARSVVKGAMYLDVRGSDVDQPDYTKMRHVGKTGQFVPVLNGGGLLYRVFEEKYYAVSGTKGHLWMEAHIAREQDDLEIDMSYFTKLKDDAIKTIEKFGSFEEFINAKPNQVPEV